MEANTRKLRDWINASRGLELVARRSTTRGIGAVWTLCATDMGLATVRDRFRQVEPKVLIACERPRRGNALMVSLSPLLPGAFVCK